MYNRLISRTQRRNMGPSVQEERCSGKTTQAILAALAEAMGSARTGVKLEARVWDEDCTSTRHAWLLVDHINGILQKLGLKFFTVKVYRNENPGQAGAYVTVQSQLFTDNPWDIE